MKNLFSHSVKFTLALILFLQGNPMVSQLEIIEQQLEQIGQYNQISEDAQQNLVVTGSGPLTLGGFTIPSGPPPQIFIAKYNPLANTWLWAEVLTVVSNPGSVSIKDMILDNAGNIYTCGYYWGTVEFGNITLISTSSSQDLFVAKADANGNFLWVKSVGVNGGQDRGDGIAVDASGNVIVTGQLYNKPGKNDIFIAKMNPAGTFTWQKRFAASGSSGSGIGVDTDIDASGNVYFTGSFAGTFKFANGSGMTITSTGGYDVFTAKLNSGGTPQWVKTGTGAGFDEGHKIYVESTGVYVGGEYSSSSSASTPITFGSITLPDAPGTVNCFLAKYATSGAVAWATRISTTSGDGAGGIGNDVNGLIPDVSGMLKVSTRYNGIKTVSASTGSLLDSIPITDNIFPYGSSNVAKFHLKDMALSSSGFVFTGMSDCGTVTIANLLFTNSICLDCNNFNSCPWGNDHYIIKSGTGDPPLAQLPGGTGNAAIQQSFISDAEKLFEVYPNPANDDVQIRIPKSDATTTIHLFDHLGRSVWFKELQQGIMMTTIDFGDKWSNGVYIIQIKQKDEIFTKQLIIAR